MRIAHVTDFYLPRLGGIELHVSDLARRQSATGHDVSVVTASPGGGREAEGFEVVRVSEAFRRPRLMHPRAPFAGAKVLVDGKFDVVHAHVSVGSPLAFWSALACVRAGQPTVVTVHSLWDWALPILRGVDLLIGLSHRPVQWTAVSGVAAESVRRIVRTPGAVTVLPNGIDPQAWRVPRSERDPHEVVLVATMRLAARKRPLPLLRMLSAVRRQVPDDVRLRVVIAGDGPALPAMRRYLARHTMQAWVSLPGPLARSDIRELYRRADVFVAPADLESFGIAALEAHCAGVPVVAKASTGIADFVRSGHDGVLVDDDAGMVAALSRLCSEPTLRTALSHHAGREADGVSWERTLPLTEAAYAQAAELMAGRSRVGVRR